MSQFQATYQNARHRYKSVNVNSNLQDLQVRDPVDDTETPVDEPLEENELAIDMKLEENELAVDIQLE